MTFVSFILFFHCLILVLSYLKGTNQTKTSFIILFFTIMFSFIGLNIFCTFQLLHLTKVTFNCVIGQFVRYCVSRGTCKMSVHVCIETANWTASQAADTSICYVWSFCKCNQLWDGKQQKPFIMDHGFIATQWKAIKFFSSVRYV